MAEPMEFKKTKIIFLAIVCFAIFVFAQDSWAVYSLPADRTIQWQGNVGVSGGVPTRTTEINCVSNYSVPIDGTSSSNAAIQNCLNGISSGQVAYLPAGTYTVTGNISIPSNKTLRGAGPGSTIIRANSNFGNYLTKGIIMFSGGYTTRSSATVVNVTSMTKGSVDITLADASAFSVGDYLFIDVLNGTWANATESCGVFGGGTTRCFSTMHKVTGKNSNILTIDPPVLHPSSMQDTPQAIKVSHSMVTRAGVENLTIKNDTGVTSGTNNNNLFMQGASECWIKNVKIERCGRYCLQLFFDNWRPELRDSWITGCINPVPSDYCYGTAFYHVTSGLIENNIYQSTSEGAIIGNVTGSVMAYNYGIDVSREDPASQGWYMGGDWSHLVHSAYNLWEGQYGAGIMLDNIHGSASQQTIFRSRYEGKKLNNLCMGATCSFAYAIAMGRYQYWNNIIGNVLGTSGYSNTYETLTFPNNGNFTIFTRGSDGQGQSQDPLVFSTLLRHRNYDYYTGTTKLCNDSGEPGCQDGVADTVLPNSMYLTAKPSWWCDETPWPAIGPDRSPLVSDIPAKRKYDGLSCTLAGGPSDTTDPTVTAFVIPTTATSLTISVSTFTATDDTGVTGYKLTESATAPLAGDAGWSGSAPANYTFATEGLKTLYAWAKDAAGNVSDSSNDSVTITLPTYTIGGIISGLSGTVILRNNGGDNLTRSANGSFTFATAIHNGDAYAVTVYSQPTGKTCVVSNGTGTVSGGNITNTSVTCSNNSDTTDPTVTAFMIPTTATSLTVSITTFTATDNVEVTDYLLTESATSPSSGDPDWEGSAPANYTFVTEGVKTLYAWAKDSMDNISESLNASVTITLSSAPATSDNDSDGNSKKKKKTKPRTISMSKKSIARGGTIIERGKKFSKKSLVLLYFSKPGGGYYPPKKIMTSSTGSFMNTYRFSYREPIGIHSWYAVDVKTGEKSKTLSYRVK